MTLKEWLSTYIIQTTKNGTLKPNSRTFNSASFRQQHKDYIELFSRVTEFCKDEPFPAKVWLVMNDKSEIPKCYCGNVVKFDKYSVGYRKHCSNKCAVKDPVVIEKARNTFIEKYGVENISQLDEIKQKKKETKQKNGTTENSKDVINKILQTKKDKGIIKNIKYGMSTDPWKTSDEYINGSVGDKVKITNMHKYGVTSTAMIPEVKEKIKNTIRERYGVEHQNQNVNIKKKIAIGKRKDAYRKHYKKYKDNPITQLVSTIHDFIKDGFVKFRCMECGNIFEKETLYNYNSIDGIFRCNKCYPHNKSIGEIEVVEYINSLDPKAYHNVYWPLKNEGKMQLDVYSETYKLAVEYDGLMFHSFGKHKHSILNNWHKHDENVHLKKTVACENNNIQLLRILDIEWKDPVKKDIWKSVISGKMGMNTKIFARKCSIREINYKEASKFLEENHLQGTATSSVNLSLVYNDDIVAVMTFSKPRYNKKYDWELIRYCSKRYTNIVGGASKLLNYFRKLHAGSIISYANRRWSNGNLYRKLGFTCIGSTKPNYFYTKDGKELYSRVQFQKHKLENVLEKYNPNLTEKENMVNNGYRIYYDCGNLIYILN